jgi:hypothetical protein
MLIVGCTDRETTEETTYKALRQNMRWSFEKSPLSARCYEMAYSRVDSFHTTVMAMNEVTCEETKLR